MKKRFAIRSKIHEWLAFTTLYFIESERQSVNRSVRSRLLQHGQIDVYASIDVNGRYSFALPN